MGVNSIKRKRAVTGKDDRISKKPRNNKDSEFRSDSQDESKQDSSNELHNAYQTKQYIPHHLIGLMYRIDLSVLCLLRKFTYEHRYPSLSLAFGDSDIHKFNNIVLSYKKKSIHIEIENVDRYYDIDTDISYAKLFAKEKQSFSINNYFDGFVKLLISKSFSLMDNIKYLIIYTNSGLDLTEERNLKKVKLKNYYPFKFDSINREEKEFQILNDFFFTNDNERGIADFYQFSRDKTMREELLKRLELSSLMRKVMIKENKLSQEFEREIKKVFLDKLVIAVNQPSREELNRIIRNEIEKNRTIDDDYYILQETILRDLTATEKDKKKLVPGLEYEFNLLMSFLNDMFLHENISFINFEGKAHDISNSIAFNYKNKITHVKAYDTNSNIGYRQLFSSIKREENNTFSKHFTFFIEELKKDNIKYFIIYTNADLDLTEEKKFKQGCSKDFYPLEFHSIDIRKKKYKILRNCSCIINEYGLYQFSQEETTRKKLLSLLKLPPSLQKEKEEGRLSDENEIGIKEKFLNKLIFAVNQHNGRELNSVIRNQIDNSNVPYNYGELHEIGLRWSESHELGPITKGIMEKLLGDVKDNRSSYQEIQNRSIDEEIKFAQSVVGKKGTLAFYRFLDFLIKGEGSDCLKVLKRNGINLANMSSILGGAGDSATKAFKDLYDLWFDVKGKKTQYLKTLEKEGIYLANISGILHGAKAQAPKAFIDLYNLWFDEEGKRTRYLKTLEKEGINLANMSSISSGAKANAEKSFKDLYDLWFDTEGKKTQYLKSLEEEGISLASMSSILSRTGTNASKAFKNLYDLWFDAEGKKTQYLKTLEKEGINLASMSSILAGARANAAKSYKDLYNVWFDAEGKKTQYLKTLEEEGIGLTNMSSILSRAGAKAPQAFKDLYDLWFDAEGKKTQYLKTLEDEGINLANISSILHGTGTNAAKAFKDLYGLWFDAEGRKTRYLKTLEKEGISLANMSSILGGAGANAIKAFKNLYDLWFDAEGKKTRYLKTLKEKRINIANISSILSGAGSNAPKAFKDLYDLWFNAEGRKTQYLKTLETQGINTANISSILSKAGAKAKDAFENLHNFWFDMEGKKTQYLNTLEKEGVDLANISSILHGAGAKAPRTFKELYNTFFDEQGNRTQHLRHFTEEKDGEKFFTLHNLSGILSKSGAQAKDAFGKLHDVCFNDKGERTELLDDFYKAGFRPRNLSCMLCGTGARASSVLKRLHSVCFNQRGEKTKLLNDFCEAGFRVCDLCGILSMAAISLEIFHYFCFIGETKKYLSHFLNKQEGFKPKNLSKILHGAGANICSALKDFHDVCFDETGNETQLLCDFYEADFTPRDLSIVLSMTGNNAASILNDFHECCFNKESYLDHFLAERELFTPKDLSKVLDGVGTKVCPTFVKLHDVCFDKAGNKTYYFNNLIESNPSNEIFNILHEKVRKAPPPFLDEQNISEGVIL